MASQNQQESQYDEIFNQKIVLPKFNLAPLSYQFLNKFDTLTQEQTDQFIEDILDEVDDLQLKLQKAEILYNLRIEDAAHHDKIIQDITTDVNKSKEEMIKFQKELEDQKRLKAQKAEYEVIAKSINQYQSQENMMKKIEQMTNEKEDYQKRSKGDEIILKQKQLHALVSMIQELKGEHAFNQVMKSSKDEDERMDYHNS